MTNRISPYMLGISKNENLYITKLYLSSFVVIEYNFTTLQGAICSEVVPMSLLEISTYKGKNYYLCTNIPLVQIDGDY
jgi:hypothetical protein